MVELEDQSAHRDAPASFLKLSWAAFHLQRLEEAARRFEESQPAIIEAQFKPKRPGYDLVFRVTQETPYYIPLMVGDVIGNLRDALDHLIYELTIEYSGVPSRRLQTAFPICERRSQWPMGPKRNKRSGEWKVQGIHPRARTLVYRMQPFYRKRGDGPFRKHPLWMLDELRNLDHHRRLHVVPTIATGVDVTVLGFEDSSIEVVRSHHGRATPKDGAIVDRLWLTPGATESDMRVEAVPTCKLALDEPDAFQRLTWLVESLKGAFQATGRVVLGFHPFQPKAVQDYFKRASVPIAPGDPGSLSSTTVDAFM